MDSTELAAPLELPTGFLEDLLPELDRPEVVGIALGGSYARGTATAFSDVDLALVVHYESQVWPKTLFYRHSLLVSVAVKSLERARSDMADPRLAPWVVPGLSEAKILVDKDGSLAQFSEELARFHWETIKEKAHRRVSDYMMMLAEPVHKVANELVKGNDPAVAYTSAKLVIVLTEVITMRYGVMVQSDSTYYQQLYEAVGEELEWPACHMKAAGLIATDLHERAKACLYLYRLTLDIVKPIMSEDHAQVAEEAAQRVSFAFA